MTNGSSDRQDRIAKVFNLTNALTQQIVMLETVEKINRFIQEKGYHSEAGQQLLESLVDASSPEINVSARWKMIAAVLADLAGILQKTEGDSKSDSR